MHSPDLDSIIKYLRKQHNNWPEVKIELKANEILDKYLDYHKESIEKAKIKEQQLVEEDLEKESLQWWLMWKSGEL